MSSNHPAITVRGLSKSYLIRRNQTKHTTLADAVVDRIKHPFRRAEKEMFWALRDLNFEVAPGEIVGIIGRNGAGKSTLLKILSRITRPTNGEVEIRGRVGSLLEVGTGFHQELTGRENIYLSGTILGMKRREINEQFDTIVDFAGIEKFLDTPVKRYSSGMYVRLAFAVAAHLQSEILIVDEVLAVGDAEFQKKCMGKMGEAARIGRTVLFVSHNMPVVQRLCARALLLNGGRIVNDGPSFEAAKIYFGQGMRTFPERTWAPSENADHIPATATLVRARITDENKKVSGTIIIHRPFSIVVEYDSYLTSVRPTVIIQLFNDEGVCLFSTVEFNCPVWSAKLICAGSTRAACYIPANLLAEGTFSVLIALGSYNPNTLYALEKDALIFQVIDECDGKGVRGNVSSEWVGVMRPMLKWDITHVEKNH